MWMQDVVYTNYMDWQETNTFINGVASASGNVELLFNEKVDRDTSLVIYDGKQIDLSHEHTYIDIQKEGITQLVYILKDIDGYALEEGEKTILLDTTLPNIVVKTKDCMIKDVLPLIDCEKVHIQILEENVDHIDVYLDDEKVEFENLEFDLDVSTKNRIIKVLCRDIAGNEIERKIEILPIVFPECLLQERTYVKDNKLDLGFESICEIPLHLHVYCDGNYLYSIDLENKDFATIDFSKSGVYTFVLEHKEYPHIKKELQGSIVYSNILPTLTLQPSAKVSNEDVFVNLNWNVPYLERGYIDVELNGIKDRHYLNETIHLFAVNNRDLFYKVIAYAKDAFGNEVWDQVIVQIDKRAPSTSLYVNNEQILDKTIIKKLPEFEYRMDDHNAAMKVEYYLNGILMDMDIEKIFNRMVRDDILKVVTYTTDTLNNLEKKEYEFVFSPDKEKEIISKSEQLTNKNEVVTFERIWNVNDKNELVLTKNVKKFQKQSKPVIHYLRKKNKVQIWTEDTIEYVLVNGKKINIKKDVLGHDFIELSLKKHKTNIEVKVKNESNRTSTLKKEEVRKQLKISFIQKIWMFIKRILNL